MRKVLLILMSAFIVSTAFSQFQIGPKFGLNFSKQKYHEYGTSNGLITVDDINNNIRTKSGIGFGLMMNIGGDHVFNFQPEFTYIMRGSNRVDNDGNNLNTRKNNYLDIDFLFNLGKTVNGKWRIYGILGPSIDIWLSKGIYDKDNKFIDDSDKFYNDGTAVDVRIDFAFVLGAGFKYKLGPGWLTFSPRYKVGVIPQTIYDNGGDSSVGITNKGFYLDFGYAFQFGGEEF